MTDLTPDIERVLSEAERQAILDSLGWDWSGSPEDGVPFPAEAAAETFAVVEQIIADREATARADALRPIVHPNRRDERDVRPWEPGDGDARCQNCGLPNIIWYTDHDLWNRVMGDEGGVLCIGCFVHRAEAFVGIGTVWALLHQSSDLNDDFKRGVSAGMAIRGGSNG